MEWGHSPEEPAKLSDLEPVFANLISVAISAIGIVLFFMLIIGGFNLITAGGEPGKIQAAWKTITYALIGLILFLSAYFILYLIKTFTGVDVSRFSIIQ